MLSLPDNTAYSAQISAHWLTGPHSDAGAQGRRGQRAARHFVHMSFLRLTPICPMLMCEPSRCWWRTPHPRNSWPASRSSSRTCVLDNLQSVRFRLPTIFPAPLSPTNYPRVACLFSIAHAYYNPLSSSWSHVGWAARCGRCLRTPSRWYFRGLAVVGVLHVLLGDLSLPILKISSTAPRLIATRRSQSCTHVSIVCGLPIDSAGGSRVNPS
ncbi:hypothetical protein B0H17DRAFT_302703 [Mycena rosella]|uniref:Uncharacterized protein n=1 Tax=Mycena rosella TaxID=1033263 RepID=A0AAD7CU84_MYCRO|nr:hypothetical protein B0H17DRAFT_302703 [Mycena rosella]